MANTTRGATRSEKGLSPRTTTWSPSSICNRIGFLASAISTAHQLSTTTLYPLRGAERVSPCQTPANPEEH